MRLRLALAALSCLLLAACASSEQIVQQQQAEQAQRQALCTSFGYQPGTPDYSRCLETMYFQQQQKAAAEQAQQAAAFDEFGRRLQRAGEALERVGAPP